MPEWTRKEPTEPGYYWYWYSDGDTGYMNITDLRRATASMQGVTLSWLGFEVWYQGPIQLPEPPQEATDRRIVPRDPRLPGGIGYDGAPGPGPGE